MRKPNPSQVTAKEVEVLLRAPKGSSAPLPDEIETLFHNAERSMRDSHDSLIADSRVYQFQSFGDTPSEHTPRAVDRSSIEGIEVRIELGHVLLADKDLDQLRGGAVVTLDELANDAVEIRAGNRLIARGEVLELQGKFGVRITQLVCEGAR